MRHTVSCGGLGGLSKMGGHIGLDGAGGVVFEYGGVGGDFFAMVENAMAQI